MIDPLASAERTDEFRLRVAPHLPSMFREARRVVHSDDLAWDAVQESLVRLWQNPRPSSPHRATETHDPRTVAPESADDGFRSRAARLSQLRGRQARRSYERRCRHERMAAEHRCPDCGMDPAEIAASKEAESRLTHALAELPPDLRRVLTLRALDDLEYGEIARRLDIPIGTVRSRLARARDCLRERLAPEMRSAG